MGLTERDKEVLDFIKRYMLENGITPTVREIGSSLYLNSTTTVQKHMERLELLGYIERKNMGSQRYKVKGIKYTEDKE